MKNLVTILSTLSLFIISIPSVSSAQSCPSVNNPILSSGIPTNSHIVGYYEGKGRLSNPSALDRHANAPAHTYRVYVMERNKQCYKIANSDLGRTMTVHCEAFQLDTETHYELRLRKLPKPATQAEAPDSEECDADYEVISSGRR